MNSKTRPFDTREFRSALSGFATGVTIVTTTAENGERVGMTASSFNSVSMDPPLILWSVTKTAGSAPVFRDAKRFAVHVLASSQAELSNQFARKGSDKFANVDCYQNEHNVPVIRGCVARFHCTTWAVHEGGDHWVIIGEVESVESNNREGLVFSDGSYATANPLQQIEASDDDGPAGTDSPIDQLLIYNLARAYRQMSKQFHESVRESGLNIPAWRILASLYGNVSRDLPDLEARTFLDAEALSDALVSLEADGLCRVINDNNGTKVSGTSEGHNRVKHLFEHGEKIDIAAVGSAGQQGLERLISQLAEVVKNTNNLV